MRGVILAGGESTVNIKGSGLGGRNQELALTFSRSAKENAQFLFLSCGTDGSDGPTDAAGAYVMDRFLPNNTESKIEVTDYLLDNNSYRYFEKMGGLIKTGPTQTNVMDIQVLLKIE